MMAAQLPLDLVDYIRDVATDHGCTCTPDVIPQGQRIAAGEIAGSVAIAVLVVHHDDCPFFEAEQ